MNTPEHRLAPAAAASEPAEQTASAEQPTGKNPPWELSPSTKAFIAQMAENLRTHDPENPKGRLRKQP